MTECKELQDWEYLYHLVLSYKHNTLTRQEVIDSFNQYYLFGYEVFNGVRQGVAFALYIKGIYTLDGYNEGKSFHCAVYAGKKVLNRLLTEYTKEVHTAHRIEERAVTLLVKRLGFKDHKIQDNMRILKYRG